MQIVINVPEKEFSAEIEDRFQDFFKRFEAETKEHLITNTSLLCGAYELETIDMFLKAFKNATLLPKGHGRLGDLDKLEKDMKNYIIFNVHDCVELVNCADTIIEADKER
jgi:hypothetical protein